MICPKCTKEVVADRLFCTWCEVFSPTQGRGERQGCLGVGLQLRSILSLQSGYIWLSLLFLGGSGV